jgi:hypothetical protein
MKIGRKKAQKTKMKWRKENGLEKCGNFGDIPRMITLKADDRSRVKLPGIKPGQVFAFEDQGNGVRVLTEVKKAVKEAFPRGSLLKYFTTEKNAEELGRLKGCVQGPSGEE